MSINSYDTIIEHTTDAQFRVWGAAFKAALTAIGLTNTADTGQIDWTTVTIPGASTKAGYEIWRFNDALQATKPIFIRFDYGTAGAGAGAPAIAVSVGTSTDGAGNINNTGAFSTALTEILGGSVIFSTVTPFASYFCYNAALGALTIAFKLGGYGLTTPGMGMCFIGRSCSSVGAPTGDGATVYTFGAGAQALAQSLNFTDNVGYAQHVNYAIVVGNVLGSAVGADIQAYLNWAHYPRVEPVNWCCSVISDEIGRVNFLTPLVGATPHNYLGLGVNSPPSSPGSNNVHFSFGMLYE